MFTRRDCIAGLVAELLNRLSNAAGPQTLPSTSTQDGTAAVSPHPKNQTTETNRSSQSISTTISLLSTLCRGSPTITYVRIYLLSVPLNFSIKSIAFALQDLLRSNLRDAMERALKGDERCTLDCMRLADLILLLLFEGRQALNRVGCAQGQLVPRAVRRADSSQTHRQLIDCKLLYHFFESFRFPFTNYSHSVSLGIRSKDTEALIEAIESGNIDVNCMDDVGQTLLNWASAFGTLEMVEYLCDKEADVNKGQRSSSLHYAACFGRPGIAKVLLKHGANPDLRDEDGKTPLDKARERIDEGHREVATILQSPGEWMSAGRNDGKSDADENAEPRGDPEMSPIYLKFFLPAFCKTFQSTMLSSVRRSSLGMSYFDFPCLSVLVSQNCFLYFPHRIDQENGSIRPTGLVIVTVFCTKRESWHIVGGSRCQCFGQ